MENNETTENTPKSVLENVFSLFVSKDDLRPAFRSPFEINNNVYATNGHTLIKCSKSDCDFDVSNNEKLLNVDAVIPIHNCNRLLLMDKESFEPLKTEDEYENEGEDIECATCDGTGQVEWDFERWSKYFDCPKCNGSGYFEQSKGKKTGRKTFGNHAVKLGVSYFNIKIFYSLLQAHDMLGGEMVMIYQSAANKAVMFKVGFCEILLMPVYFNSKEYYESVLEIN